MKRIDMPLNKAMTKKAIKRLGIDVPAGKAVFVVEVEGENRDCRECVLISTIECYAKIACSPSERKDGKNVIFKFMKMGE